MLFKDYLKKCMKNPEFRRIWIEDTGLDEEALGLYDPDESEPELNKIRDDFLIYINNPDMVYLDSCATSLKPRCVLNKMNEYYNTCGVNIHRGVYELSYKATSLYDEAREVVKEFINAKDSSEIIFVRNASEALNLCALTYGKQKLKKGDVIITSELEHHSSFLPWLNLSKELGLEIRFIPLDNTGRITIENFKKVLDDKVKVVAINYYSNVMGYMSPIKEIASLTHEVGGIVICDAAQAVAHTRVDVLDLDCDFLAFSGHKMMGPTGVGVLYGKKKILKQLKPLYYGGDMNEDVSKTSCEVKDAPWGFETGTPAIAEVIGLMEAIRYINRITYEKIHKHTKALYDYTIDKLKKLDGITIYNTNPELPIISFNINGVHPHDAATIFDQANVCLRAGHHCAQLLTKYLNVPGTLRGSFYIYNTYHDCDIFISKVKDAIDFFKKFNLE